MYPPSAETIQKMIANLPAKRATRRVIQFKEDEIKTRSQATMASVSFYLCAIYVSQLFAIPIILVFPK